MCVEMLVLHNDIQTHITPFDILNTLRMVMSANGLPKTVLAHFNIDRQKTNNTVKHVIT